MTEAKLYSGVSRRTALVRFFISVKDSKDSIVQRKCGTDNRTLKIYVKKPCHLFQVIFISIEK